MPEDRDVYQRRQPPPKVAQQIASPSVVTAEIQEEITGRYIGIQLDVKRLQRWKEEITPVIHGTSAKVDTLLDLASRAEAERERRAARDAEELARKRGHTITVIKTLGAALAIVVAALVGRGAL